MHLCKRSHMAKLVALPGWDGRWSRLLCRCKKSTAYIVDEGTVNEAPRQVREAWRGGRGCEGASPKIRGESGTCYHFVGPSMIPEFITAWL